MQAIADLMGLTVTQLYILAGAGVALVVGWYVLKSTLKIASRVFAIGCVGIAVLVGVLASGFLAVLRYLGAALIAVPPPAVVPSCDRPMLPSRPRIGKPLARGLRLRSA
jgi:hypothetical protein